MARRRRPSNYQLFMTSFLRARAKSGMSQGQRNELMKEGARAWQRAKRGHNPFPDFGERAEVILCPECGATLHVEPEHHGKVVECGSCGAQFQVEVS